MDILCQFIIEHFWQILIIIAFISHKSLWRFGILVAFIELLFGYKMWLYCVIVPVAFLIDSLSINSKINKKNEKIIEEIKETLKDPDYQ